MSEDFDQMTSGDTDWYWFKKDPYRSWLRGTKFEDIDSQGPTYLKPVWGNVDWVNVRGLLDDAEDEVAMLLIADLLEEAGLNCPEIINQCRRQHPCWRCPESCGYAVGGDKCAFCFGDKIRKVPPNTKNSWVVKLLRSQCNVRRPSK